MLPIVPTVIKARNIAKYIAYSSFTGLQYNRDVITSYVKGILQPTGESIECMIYTYCVDYPYLLCVILSYFVISTQL